MRRRVVITGMGVITPAAHTVRGLFQSQIEGRSNVGPIAAFNARTFPTTFAAEVKGFELGRYISRPERFAHASSNTCFALAAASIAVEDAGLRADGGEDRSRFGLYLGTGEGAPDFQAVISSVAWSYRPEKRALDSTAYITRALRRYHREREYEQELHTTPAHLANCFGFDGPNYNCLTACAAGTQAVGEAMELIRHGDADVMLSGGSHSMIEPFGVSGFNNLTALSTRNAAPQHASRPFDRLRDGFVLGEGAGMLVLEELEHARRRRATIYAEMIGYGVTGDAYRATDNHPEGRGAILCMRTALADAGLAPRDIGYINAHGTSTQLNDRVETLAIKQVFGEDAARVPISSSKSMLGHLIGAAGAVELIISVLAIREGVLPPTINYEEPDPECDLDYIPNVAREKKVRHALSNSFGFGGQNASVIVSRFED